MTGADGFDDAAGTGAHETTVTFLEMTAPAVLRRPPPAPRGRVAILRAEAIPVHFYRYLYHTVGRDYVWVFRKRMSDEALAAHLATAGVEVFVLYAEGVPAGFAELDFTKAREASLAYFGLVPDYLGRGFGAWFLQQMIDLMWARGAARLLVNTCTLDHPAALPLYQRMGFTPYAQEHQTITP